jgi:transposase
MARSRGTTISVKVPINWDAMTKRTQQRLRQIVGRDTRIIKSFLGVIEQHEKPLLVGKLMNRINESVLHEITMTSTLGKAKRTVVQHDMKAYYPRASQNEITECRKTAVSLYESYLTLRQKKKRKVSRPCMYSSSRRIPRWMFVVNMFKLETHTTQTSRWWLNVRDSLDSQMEQRKRHNRLRIPLKISPFHINQFNRGDVKACQVFTDQTGKWWVTFAVRISSGETSNSENPIAVLGIDLGIKKAACSTLVTAKRISETRFFKQKDKIKIIEKYDRLIAALQGESSGCFNGDGALRTLRLIRHKRENVAREYDRVLVRELLDYIDCLSEKYTLYIAVGRLKNIRRIAQKGNFKSKKFRGMIHSWAFARVTKGIEQGLAQKGWSVTGTNSQFHVIPETWTSIKCWKCGRTGIRSKQSLFVCSCGFKTNADRNGSLNIARRLIKLIPFLQDENGLGRWLLPEKVPAPKTRRKSLSKRESSLSVIESLSDSGESAAVHFVQRDLASFGDETSESDHDSAVVRTVEVLSVTGSDTPVGKQKKEVRSSGGIPSR